MGFWMLLENLVCIGSISLWETLYEKNNTDVRVKKKKKVLWEGMAEILLLPRGAQAYNSETLTTTSIQNLLVIL